MDRLNEIRKAFDRSAPHYDGVSAIQRETGNRLFERLDYLKLTPRYILDLGCGTGYFSEKLRKRYPKAVIIGLDISTQMLHASLKQQRFWRRWPLVAGDMNCLPFAAGMFDLIFSNQTVHWCPQLPTLFQELNRVMAPEGCLMFSTLGPDTFKEIRASFASLDNHSHTMTFLDMHDVGDSLMGAGFLSPVMDMDMMTLHYSSAMHLLSHLKKQGVRNISGERASGLMGKGQFAAFKKNLSGFANASGQIPLTYEMVFGHAFKGASRVVGDIRETIIPISQVKKKLS